MSDEPTVTPAPSAPKARRGRPPKRRHDPPAAAPVDGDYSLDRIVNKQDGWDYGLLSDRDRARRQHQGWEPERWGKDCARPLFDYGHHKDGEEIRVNGQLTLMRIPTARRNDIRTAERKWHTEAKSQLQKQAENSGGKFTKYAGIQF